MGQICRFCREELDFCIADLGAMPLANALANSPDEPSERFPLKLYFCEKCHLVQVGNLMDPARLFTDYNYRSSFSHTWNDHVRHYCEKAASFLANRSSRVIEIGSNDGGLLRHFLHQGYPVLGFEPAKNIADIAAQSGVPTIAAFFGKRVAEFHASQGRVADLIVANNVIPHVPELDDFVAGLKVILTAGGTLTLEFHYLRKLIDEVQFDAIYHEHVSYFSATTISKVLNHHGLKVFDSEILATHGGSLRIWACHNQDPRGISLRHESLLAEELEIGLSTPQYFLNFDHSVRMRAQAIADRLLELQASGKRVAAYGAPAKATTLLNYCGVNQKHLAFTVDKNPMKQGHWIPGTGIPILPPDTIATARPDVVVNLCWNLDAEIAAHLAYIKEWRAQYRLL